MSENHRQIFMLPSPFSGRVEAYSFPMAVPRPPLGDLPALMNIPVIQRVEHGTKRKAEDAIPLDHEVDDEDEFEYYERTDKTANQVRGMINRFLDSGEMKKGEFANALGVSSNSLSRFLGHSGKMEGAGSATYSSAYRFFKAREKAGVKPPKKAKIAPAAAANLPDISNIHLDGEEYREVEVYDNCDEVRRKINAHLLKTGITPAQFSRDIAAQLYDGSKIQGKMLTDFRGKKGPSAGNTSKVFYAAYVYFEKLRIAEGKPKSKHRNEMEDAWEGLGGFDTNRRANQKYICAAGMRPYEDKFGKIFVR